MWYESKTTATEMLLRNSLWDRDNKPNKGAIYVKKNILKNTMVLPSCAKTVTNNMSRWDKKMQ